jgi:hypothetical protein
MGTAEIAYRRITIARSCTFRLNSHLTRIMKFLFITPLAGIILLSGCTPTGATNLPVPVISTSSPMVIGPEAATPAPAGSELHVEDMIMTVTGIVRPADGVVAAGDIFNPQPGQYQHYIFITLVTTCISPANGNCHLSPYRFLLTGSDGLIKYAERMISGVDGIMEETDLSANESLTTMLPFITSIGNSRLVLIYEAFPSGKRYYFSLP